MVESIKIPIVGTLCKNIKTEKLYKVIGVGTDCTNARDGAPIVTYISISDPKRKLLHRDRDEFLAKFTYILVTASTNE